MSQINRQAAIDALTEYGNGQVVYISVEEAVRRIEQLPPAQPEIIYCKDCKHWKDSDGIYRRGFNAESKCPVNSQAVYEGNFYCGYAERRTDEVD